LFAKLRLYIDFNNHYQYREFTAKLSDFPELSKRRPLGHRAAEGGVGQGATAFAPRSSPLIMVTF
jgi:hypothetical protein